MYELFNSQLIYVFYLKFNRTLSDVYKSVIPGPAKDMLDGMQVLLTGSGTFDEDFYAEFVDCLDQFDPRIMGAVDAQWAGMLEYANVGGNPEGQDPWASCPQVTVLLLIIKMYLS